MRSIARIRIELDRAAWKKHRDGKRNPSHLDTLRNRGRLPSAVAGDIIQPRQNIRQRRNRDEKVCWSGRVTEGNGGLRG